MQDATQVHPRLIDTLITSYSQAVAAQRGFAAAYQPAVDWKRILDQEWERPRRAIHSGNRAELAGFLSNFFRNEGLSGFWGETEMFEHFINDSTSTSHRASLISRQFGTWREIFPDTPIHDLAAPPVGNPWGYYIGGTTIYERKVSAKA